MVEVLTMFLPFTAVTPSPSIFRGDQKGEGGLRPPPGRWRGLLWAWTVTKPQSPENRHFQGKLHCSAAPVKAVPSQRACHRRLGSFSEEFAILWVWELIFVAVFLREMILLKRRVVLNTTQTKTPVRTSVLCERT